jgi:hypothetical protein
MKTESRLVVAARFGEERYAFAFSRDGILVALNRSYAYREQREDVPYALGTHWAEDETDLGWRIIEREYECPVLVVTITGEELEKRHILWECPFCHRGYSEDYEGAPLEEVILSCGCLHSREHPYNVARIRF